jgi:hypothetical protein
MNLFPRFIPHCLFLPSWRPWYVFILTFPNMLAHAFASTQLPPISLSLFMPWLAPHFESNLNQHRNLVHSVSCMTGWNICNIQTLLPLRMSHRRYKSIYRHTVPVRYLTSIVDIRFMIDWRFPSPKSQASLTYLTTKILLSYFKYKIQVSFGLATVYATSTERSKDCFQPDQSSAVLY